MPRGNVGNGKLSVPKEPPKELMSVKGQDDLDFEAVVNPEITRPVVVKMNKNCRLFVEAVKGKLIEMLIDTGADISVCVNRVVREWLANGTKRVQTTETEGLQSSPFEEVRLPNGQNLSIVGTITMGIRFGQHSFAIKVQVVNDLEGIDIIAGRDFLRVYGVHVDNLYSHVIFCPLVQLLVLEEYKIAPGQSVTLKATSQMIIPDGVTSIIHGLRKIVRPYEEVKILVGEVVSQFREGTVAVQFSNPNPHSIRLYQGELLAYFEPVVGLAVPEEQQQLWNLYIPEHYKCEEGKPCPAQPKKLLKPPVKKSQNQGEEKTEGTVQVDLSGSNINAQERQVVAQLLQEFRDVFVGRDGVIGCTDLIQHHIRTEPGTQPIASRPYRVNYKNRKVIEEQVRDMLSQKIIRPSASPWSAPVVLVPKPDGSLRFCVDYRKLNDVTVLEQFPLPDIRQSLEIFGSKGARYFSTLDLKSAYWNVKLCDHSAEKSAFVTPTGLYEFIRLPFGLSGAPMCFSRLMSEVLKGLLWEVCLVYLDDIIIFSATVKEHIRILRQVLERLRLAKLKLSASKCYLFRTEVKFLGHYVSANGIRMDYKKVEAVRDYPVPTNITQMRAFLGLAGYYRHFCAGYAQVAKPLTEMTRHENAEDFRWGPTQQEAFEKLKEMLISAPLLAYPDPNLPYILYTDASRLAVGYVLCQKQGEVEKVICYGGKQLSEVESKAGITEQEFLAVCYAIDDCKCYLLGTEFVVVTDHAALKGFIKTSEPNAKLARRILALQPYKFTIEYRPGRKHSNADALSRRPYKEQGVGLDTQEPLTAFVVFAYEKKNGRRRRKPKQKLKSLMDGTDVHQFAIQQIQDPDLKPYYEFQRDGSLPEDPKIERIVLRTKDDFVLKEGILYHMWIRPGPGNLADRTVLQLAVPREYHEELLNSYHDSSLAGHRRFQKTCTQLKLKYWWPQLVKQVMNWVNSCKPCAQADKTKQRRNVPLQVAAVSGPFEHLHVDIVGKLAVTKRGNQYILSMVDALTRWVELVPLTNQEGITVAQGVFEAWICRYGAPRKITSDRGSNFLSAVFRYLSNTFQIQRIKTSAYTPKSNGILERRHNDIVTSLRRLIGNEPNTWDDYIKPVAYAMNTMVCRTTGFSPYEMVFGRTALLPVDLTLPIPEVTSKGMQGQIQTLQYKLQCLEKMIQERDAHMKRIYKEEHDRKAGHEVYQPGDLCWVYTPSSGAKLGPGKKLLNAWIGPYQVIKIKGVNVQLKRCSDDASLQQQVHVNRIKPFISREVRPVPPPLEIVGLMEQGPDLAAQDIEPSDIIADEGTQSEESPQEEQESRIHATPKASLEERNTEQGAVPKVKNREIKKKKKQKKRSHKQKKFVEEEYYEVEEVLQGRLDRDGHPEVLLKWRGYPQPTWEPMTHLNKMLQEVVERKGLFPEIPKEQSNKEKEVNLEKVIREIESRGSKNEGQKPETRNQVIQSPKESAVKLSQDRTDQSIQGQDSNKIMEETMAKTLESKVESKQPAVSLEIQSEPSPKVTQDNESPVAMRTRSRLRNMKS